MSRAEHVLQLSHPILSNLHTSSGRCSSAHLLLKLQNWSMRFLSMAPQSRCTIFFSCDDLSDHRGASRLLICDTCTVMKFESTQLLCSIDRLVSTARICVPSIGTDLAKLALDVRTARKRRRSRILLRPMVRWPCKKTHPSP